MEGKKGLHDSTLEGHLNQSLKVKKVSVQFSLEINQFHLFLVEKRCVAMHSLYLPFNMKDLISITISTSSVYRRHIYRNIAISAYLTVTAGTSEGAQHL